jgi:hypothetical protein
MCYRMCYHSYPGAGPQVRSIPGPAPGFLPRPSIEFGSRSGRHAVVVLPEALAGPDAQLV